MKHAELKRYSIRYCTAVRCILDIGTEKMAAIMGYSKQTLEKWEKTQGKNSNANTKKRFEILYTQAIDKAIEEADSVRTKQVSLFTEQYYDEHPEERA